MNYIYDITLNFNKELYNFYEWNSDDNIEFFLKIPVFKVEDAVLNDFVNNNFTVDKKILNNIINKTECYNKKSIKVYKYCAIFTSLKKAVAIVFNENGDSILKSYLSIEEEDEILEFSKLIKYYLVEYIINKKNNKKNFFITRNEKDTKIKMLKIIDDIYNNKEYNKLKYVFYEVYNERLNDEYKIYIKLIKLIESNSEKIYKIKKILTNIKVESKSY